MGGTEAATCSVGRRQLADGRQRTAAVTAIESGSGVGEDRPDTAGPSTPLRVTSVKSSCA